MKIEKIRAAPPSPAPGSGPRSINSYHLRVRKFDIDLTKAMTTVKEMLDDNPAGFMDDFNLISGRKRDRKPTEFFEFKDDSSDDVKRTRK